MSIGPNGSSHMVSPGWSQDPTLQHLPPQGEGRQEHPSRDGIVMPSMVPKPILAFSSLLMFRLLNRLRRRKDPREHQRGKGGKQKKRALTKRDPLKTPKLSGVHWGRRSRPQPRTFPARSAAPRRRRRRLRQGRCHLKRSAALKTPAHRSALQSWCPPRAHPIQSHTSHAGTSQHASPVDLHLYSSRSVALVDVHHPSSIGLLRL